MEISDEYYEKVKKQAIWFFKNNKIIKSVCFWDVKITPEWFNYIEWKDKNHKRWKKEACIRYLCFLQTRHILENLWLYQEFKEEFKKFNIKKKKKIVVENKLVSFYWFVAVVSKNKIRVKIVLRKVDWWDKFEFVSVIPAWKITWYNDIKIKELFFDEK